MVDVGQPLRASYYSVLNGNITIDGQPVPVVDEKLDVDVSEQDVYVLFTSQDEENETVSNKTRQLNIVLMRLQIVNIRRSTNSKEVVEDVSNQILNLLFPTNNTTALTLADPLHLTYAKLQRAAYNPLMSNEKGYLISKVLTIKNRVTQ